MANKSIPLVHGPDGVGYKLLELPPELLAVLESADPPVLKLESSPDSSATLTTGAYSWTLRQKNTSNALLLLTASDAASAASSQLPGPGLKVIATMHDTVELVPEASQSAPSAARGKWHEKFAAGR